MKKFLSLIIAAVMLISVFSFTASASSVPGDVDNNGQVDADDAIYLLYYTFFPEDYPIEISCDFDQNGSIDADDAIHLLYYTFFPEEYPIDSDPYGDFVAEIYLGSAYYYPELDPDSRCDPAYWGTKGEEFMPMISMINYVCSEADDRYRSQGDSGLLIPFDAFMEIARQYYDIADGDAETIKNCIENYDYTGPDPEDYADDYDEGNYTSLDCGIYSSLHADGNEVYVEWVPIAVNTELYIYEPLSEAKSYAVNGDGTVTSRHCCYFYGYRYEIEVTWKKGGLNGLVLSSVRYVSRAKLADEPLPDGAEYQINGGSKLVGDGYSVGFPESNDGDVYTYEGYKYTYSAKDDEWTYENVGGDGEPEYFVYHSPVKGVEMPDDIIPEGDIFYDYDGDTLVGDGLTVRFPESFEQGDCYDSGDYEYAYNCFYYRGDGYWYPSAYREEYGDGWFRYKVHDESGKGYYEKINGVTVRDSALTDSVKLSIEDKNGDPYVNIYVAVYAEDKQYRGRISSSDGSLDLDVMAYGDYTYNVIYKGEPIKSGSFTVGAGGASISTIKLDIEYKECKVYGTYSFMGVPAENSRVYFDSYLDFYSCYTDENGYFEIMLPDETELYHEYYGNNGTKEFFVIVDGDTEFNIDVPFACGHEETRTVGYVEPGYSTEGYSGDLYCARCGKFIKKGSVIPAIKDMKG